MCRAMLFRSLRFEKRKHFFDVDIVVKNKSKCGWTWSVLLSPRLVSPQHFDHCDDAYPLSIRVQTTLNHIRIVNYYVAVSVNEQDKPIPALWLATLAGTGMELSCSLGITCCVAQEPFPQKSRKVHHPYNKSFITKPVRPRWPDIGLVIIILRIYGPRRGRGP